MTQPDESYASSLKEQVEELEVSVIRSQAGSHINSDTVRRIVERDFPTDDPSTILSILDEYGQSSTDFGRARIQLAILTLSKGDLNQLRRYVNEAKIDFRDILVMAERSHQFGGGDQARHAFRGGPARAWPWAAQAWWENSIAQRLLATLIVIVIITIWVLLNN